MMLLNRLFGSLRSLRLVLDGGKYPLYWAECKPWQAVGGQTNRIKAAAFVAVFALSGCAIAEETELEKPPEVEPYQLPTMDGKEPTINDHIEPLITAPSVDADALFNTLLACYPAVSKWKIDVDLKAGARAGETLNTITGTDLGKNYVEIVASMPLYSSTELDRKQRNEYDLRGDTAKRVAAFVSAISSRNHAIRELALFKSLEARAAIRVQSGVTEANEQVTYLKEVAGAQDALIKSEADIMETRLALSSLCSKSNYPRINNYLKQLAAVPKADK